MTGWSADEVMIVTAARTLRDGQACFATDGPPATVARLARRLHAPNLLLVHESGVVESAAGSWRLAPAELANLWLQPGRFDVGLLAAEQLDRLGNLNSTSVGEADEPGARLAGAGSLPEAAAACREVVLVQRHRRQAFVEQVDFVTAVGHGEGPGARERLGLRGGGPTRVVTDLGVLDADPETCELMLTALQPGATIEQARAETGWDLAVTSDPAGVAAPSAEELDELRGITEKLGGDA